MLKRRMNSAADCVKYDRRCLEARHEDAGTPAHSHRLARAGAPWAEAGGRGGDARRSVCQPDRGHGAGRADRAPSAWCPCPLVFPSLPAQPTPPRSRPRPPGPGAHHSSAFSAQWSHPGKVGTQKGGVPTASRPPVSRRAPRASPPWGSGTGSRGWERPGVAGFTLQPTCPGARAQGPSRWYVPSRRGSLWPGRHTARWWTVR